MSELLRPGDENTERSFPRPLKEIKINEAIENIKRHQRSGVDNETGEFENNALLTDYVAVEGSHLTVVFTNTGQQKNLLKFLWGVNNDNVTSDKLPIYTVDVQSLDPENNKKGTEVVTARVLYDSTLMTDSELQIIISRGLEQRLGAEEGQFLILSGVRPDFASLNLDERYYKK